MFENLTEKSYIPSCFKCQLVFKSSVGFSEIFLRFSGSLMSLRQFFNKPMTLNIDQMVRRINKPAEKETIEAKETT